MAEWLIELWTFVEAPNEYLAGIKGVQKLCEEQDGELTVSHYGD
jgi:hypothetical protein